MLDKAEHMCKDRRNGRARIPDIQDTKICVRHSIFMSSSFGHTSGKGILVPSDHCPKTTKSLLLIRLVDKQQPGPCAGFLYLLSLLRPHDQIQLWSGYFQGRLVQERETQTFGYRHSC